MSSYKYEGQLKQILLCKAGAKIGNLHEDETHVRTLMLT